MPAGISRCQPAKTSKLLQEVQTSSQEGVFIQLLGSFHLAVATWQLPFDSCHAVVRLSIIEQPMSLNTSQVLFFITYFHFFRIS